MDFEYLAETFENFGWTYIDDEAFFPTAEHLKSIADALIDAVKWREVGTIAEAGRLVVRKEIDGYTLLLNFGELD